MNKDEVSKGPRQRRDKAVKMGSSAGLNDIGDAIRLTHGKKATTDQK